MSVTGENHAVVVGLDVGGTKTNATVLDETGAFLIDRMMETPSRVHQGPAYILYRISNIQVGDPCLSFDILKGSFQPFA